MLAWSQLHGVVSLEITGQYAGMGHDTGNLARAQLDMLTAGYLGPGRSRR
ncbi:MAG TPA: TetR-like C-terminal domain-containing protein [Streptomyces sp.]|nr:TetR-like C-terminal domain-containing protein [Streptomyces sp.]